MLKKYFIPFLLLVLLLSLPLSSPATSETSDPCCGGVFVRDVSFPGRWYTVVISSDSDGLKLDYFRQGFTRYLGIEAFRDGKKIKDTFPENDEYERWER